MDAVSLADGQVQRQGSHPPVVAIEDRLLHEAEHPTTLPSRPSTPPPPQTPHSPVVAVEDGLLHEGGAASKAAQCRAHTGGQALSSKRGGLATIQHLRGGVGSSDSRLRLLRVVT